MNELFNNAIDSVEFGLRLFLIEESKFKTAHKHALLSVFHGIELLLKARLFEEHPLLIYKNLEAPLSDDSTTVGLREILARFRNCKINIDNDETNVLEDLRCRRNRIAHHCYRKDPQDYLVLGKALKFVYDFLPKQMETSLEDHLAPELYRRAREAILSYEERFAEAEAEVRRLTTPRTKDDLDSLASRATCPNCNNETMVIGTEHGDYCFFCREAFAMQQCPSCGQYVAPDYFDGMAVCRDCFEYRVKTE
jgi:transcription elongation factor Elf1